MTKRFFTRCYGMGLHDYWDFRVISTPVDQSDPQTGRARSIAMRYYEKRYPKKQRMKLTFWPRFSRVIYARNNKRLAKVNRRNYDTGSWRMRQRLERRLRDQMFKLHSVGHRLIAGPFVSSLIQVGRWSGWWVWDDKL